MTERLSRPIDAAGLAAFRILFGAVMFAGTIRFLASGWIEKQYVEPRFFFKYYGFDWVEVWPAWGLYLHYGALAALSLLVAVGLFYRASIVLFTLLFAYAQLMDVTNYLNHYYLIVLLALLMSFLPLHRMWSLDARLRPELRRNVQPAWMLYLLRFQVAVVYVNAGLAKVGSDWLLAAQPLSIWMNARTDTPLIGPWLSHPEVALFMSWAGFLFDTTIVLWLSIRRTRVAAFLVLLVFHFFTHVFFEIGMFPFIMPLAALLFFPPSWLRRWLKGAPHPTLAAPIRCLSAPQLATLGCFCAFQLLLPLRSWIYGGSVLWHEQGMRFAWKVMVREKSGSITYRVRDPGTGREWQISPFEYLTWRQANEMSAQPDLILQLAHHIGRDVKERRGLDQVEVRVDAWVSLNGRPPARLIDPGVDLITVSDGVAKASWILPAPDGPPIHLVRR